jgi:hypothetical protein
MSYTNIGRNRKKFLLDGCRDIVEQTCRIVSWVETLSVARIPFVLYALASPFNVLMKVYWPKFKGKLKSIPIIFSRNLVYLFKLQQFTQKLMGQ